MNHSSLDNPFFDLRPPLSARTFSSRVIKRTIEEVGAQIADPELAWIFSNCLPNTLDTTIKFSRDAQGRPDTFVITGDIYAMWLRDSTNQVWPYLDFAAEDPELRELLAGVVHRQAAGVLIDPYALCGASPCIASDPIFSSTPSSACLPSHSPFFVL